MLSPLGPNQCFYPAQGPAQNNITEARHVTHRLAAVSVIDKHG